MYDNKVGLIERPTYNTLSAHSGSLPIIIPTQKAANNHCSQAAGSHGGKGGKTANKKKRLEHTVLGRPRAII